jgi:hypothetical protein
MVDDTVPGSVADLLLDVRVDLLRPEQHLGHLERRTPEQSQRRAAQVCGLVGLAPR